MCKNNFTMPFISYSLSLLRFILTKTMLYNAKEDCNRKAGSRRRCRSFLKADDRHARHQSLSAFIFGPISSRVHQNYDVEAWL